MTWRDWWRGWSDRDLDSALRKTRNAAPGAIIPLTKREFQAHVDYSPATITGVTPQAETTTTSKTIGEIRDRRSANNVLWMRILEIAIERAPDEAKITLRAINTNDRAISDLLAELAK